MLGLGVITFYSFFFFFLVLIPTCESMAALIFIWGKEQGAVKSPVLNTQMNSSLSPIQDQSEIQVSQSLGSPVPPSLTKQTNPAVLFLVVRIFFSML